MPRAIWTGSISFGLVTAPVRLYAAIDEHDLELHLVHVEDGSRIGYQKICKAEDKRVPDDEIAKGYELDGEVVLLEDEDFEAARGEPTKTIEIEDFVSYEEIDPIYFERTYYLGTQDGAEKVYRLLVAAMERSGLAAVVRYFLRDREQLGCLRVRDGLLLLEKMYYADEIRPVDELRPDRRSGVDEKELELALDLVDRYRGSFDPSRYEDTYVDRLRGIVRKKGRGETIEAPEAKEAPEAPDLMSALRESVARATRDGGKRRGSAKPTNGSALDGLSVGELAKRAGKLGIEGRSKMTKRQLVGAIRKAES
ncbi:MAG TPA: Ku protein [Gaiellaceae bacterium]|nr:Ku protein [Gaiellaceae bacterium]